MLKTRGLVLIMLGMVLTGGGCAAKESPAQGPQVGARGTGGSTRADTPSVPATAPAALDEREVAGLIAQLGDADFKVRETATLRLLTGGISAIPVLKKAQQETGDAEIRTRLGTILGALPLWNGRETVAQYAQRMGIRQTALTLDLGDKVTMKVTLIPAGKFLMGSPETEKDRDHREVQHEVTISKPFYMGVTQVTVNQFTAFVKDSGYKSEAETDGKGGEGCVGYNTWMQDPKFTWRGPGFVQGDDHPVVEVSWNDAAAFCAWLSKKDGKTYRLPTEAEWEYACRAGTTTPYNTGETISTDQANYNGYYDIKTGQKGVYLQKTVAVCSFKPNAWGLYDMHGNVREWCGDWYGEYLTDSVTDPTGPGTGNCRVLRGGSWDVAPELCRSAARFWIAPGIRYSNFGFRVMVAGAGGD